ncbi:MAG TPA: VWA domain-containing protein [Anaerolineae bacterium]|nr:VWA domain-containing protein [Anaerolineae bacterium]HQK13633.1 VWA domain-containing protein [Anaerolineae bacterium]
MKKMKRINWHRKAESEKGQSLVLLAFSIFVLIGFAGIAVDVGLSYVDRVRARRAADAAALAAASELPLEAAAQVRALEYLEANGYPCGLQVQRVNGVLLYSCSNPETRVEINSGYPESYVAGPGAEDAQRVIVINTVPYRDNVFNPDTASRIEVIVQQASPVFFMRVLGFRDLRVSGRAVAENINNLDVVLVYDNSGSMEFDTLCYGCWSPRTGVAYPDGNRWPLPWNGPASGPPAHCSGNAPLTYSGNKYIIIEAEEYSNNNVPYDREGYSQGMTYWVMQRNGSQAPSWHKNASGGAGALGRDAYGAYISHFPYYNYTSYGTGVSCTLADLTNGGMCSRAAWVLNNGGPFPAPRVDYDFTMPSSPSSATWYVWLRGQGGMVMWGLDNNAPASVTGDGTQSFTGASNTYNGANSGDWRWVRLGSLGTLMAGSSHTLHLWAGSSGFDVDRIIVTTDSRTPQNAQNADTAFATQVLNSSALDNNRTGSACDPCDARFGGYPGGPGGNQPPHCVLPGFPPEAPQNYRYTDDIYDDEQPIRGAVEAAKRFVLRMDPQYDQIGLVSYNTNATIRNELECVRKRGVANCNQSVINNTVIASLDSLHAGGSTNIGQAILFGIQVLSHQSGHYGRPGAAHIMILMTDGEANQVGGLDPACYAQDFWPHNSGNTSNDQAKDCVVFYARQARDNGIVLFTITLGASADVELMQFIAEMTGGVHRHAPRPEQLDPIFDELYNRIFLRLVE